MTHTQEQQPIHDIRPASVELDVALPEHSRVNGKASVPRLRATNPVSDAHEDRLEFLMGEAEAEGIALREDSLREFRTFVDTFPVTRKGLISYSYEGNLSVSWRDWADGGNSSVGLHFLGDGKIQYAFLWGDESEIIPDPYGECGPKEAAKKIRGFKLEYLLTS